MALYGPFVQRDLLAAPDANGVHPAFSGFFCITEQATYDAHAGLLAAYKVDPQLPAQNVLSGDNPAAPMVTITLRFADMVTTQEVMAQVNAAPASDPPALPAEIPMERVLIVLNHQGMSGAVQSYIDSLAEPEKTDAQILLAHAANLVIGGTLAQQFKAFAGLTDAQFNALIAVAQNLQL